VAAPSLERLANEKRAMDLQTADSVCKTGQKMLGFQWSAPQVIVRAEVPQTKNIKHLALTNFLSAHTEIISEFRGLTNLDLALAAAALARLRSRRGEDIDAWASRLALDLVAAGEREP